MKCPHCDRNICFVAKTPAKQTVTMTITSDTDMFDAEPFGESLAAFAKSLRCVGEAIGNDVVIFLQGVEISTGKVSATLIVASHVKEPTE